VTIYNAPGIDYDAHIAYGGGTSVVTSEDLPSFMLQATDKAGVSSLLPKVVVDNMSFESSAPGAISLSVVEGTPGYAQVAEYSKIDLLMNGVAVPDGSWLLRESDYNETGGLSKTKKWTGITFLWDRLAHTQVWNDATYKYTLKSPGFIWNDLFLKAQARGAFAGFTWDFTSAVDSLGNAWPEQVTYEFKPGISYADVATNMVDSNIIEIWSVGTKVMLVTHNRSKPAAKALLVVGKDVADAPQKTSAASVASHVMLIGDNDTVVTMSEPATQTKFGYREEVSVSAGGTGTPLFQGQAALVMGNDVRTQRTYNVIMAPGRPYFPMRDYFIEDSIRVEHGGNLKVLRVKQITLQVASGGVMSAGLVLNDKFLEFDLAIAKAVAGIANGSIISGNSRDSTPDDQKDKTIPSPMTGLVLSSGVYQNGEGRSKAWVQAAWDPITTNTDGSAISDLDHYDVVWWYGDMPFTSHKDIIVDASTTTVMFDNLDPGREVIVYVYSKDSSGHQGSWTGTQTIVTNADTIPPNQLSAPTLRSIMKQLVVTWNGLDFGGNVVPADFKQARVYTQLASPFDPTNKTDGTFKGYLTAAGDLQITGFSIGDSVTVRLVGEDISGNLSTPSAEVTIIIAGVAGADMNANTIMANNIGVGQVNAVAIAAGAVNTDKITLGQTDNLVQDPGFTSALWRARRLTTEFAEQPSKWAFSNWDFIMRSGYYLQCLSTAAGVNGGRLYITDWINMQMGEIYYAAATIRQGENAPNVDARFHLGFDLEYRDGTRTSDFGEYPPTSNWLKMEYQLPIQPNWGKIRFWVRAWNLTAGDIAVDDVEVKAMVGTTGLAGSRMQITPLGLNAYDFLDNKTIELLANTGDFTARGTIKSGFTGKRVEINPGNTYLPEIRFYPVSGNLFAYINASDNGTVPFIGINAPDTGASSQALILYDTGFQLGEINKSLGSISGAGIQTSGSGGTAYMNFAGRMGAGGSALDLFSSYRFIVATGGTGFTSLSIPIAKGPATSSGFVMPLYSLARPGTSQPVFHQISASSTTAWTLLITRGDAGNLTNVSNHIHVFYVRSDTD